MTRSALVIAVLVVAAAGCGGNGDGEEAGGGGCTAAKAELLSTVSERDRLFVDQQLVAATRACEGELGSGGTTERCSVGRADLEAAAAEETPPSDLEARVDDAVAACVGTTITSTIPAP